MKILNTKMKDIANAIVKATTGKSVHELRPPKKDDNKEELYKVQTGAFKDKENAEKLTKELKK